MRPITAWSMACVAIGSSIAVGQCFPRRIATLPLDGSRVHAVFDGTTGAVTNPSTLMVDVVEHVNGEWQVTQSIVSDDMEEGDGFGNVIDISGSRMLIGAYAKDEAGQSNAGAAYVFEKSGGGWEQVAKLLPSDGGRNEFFGEAIAIRGDRAVVSSRDEAGTWRGAVYVFDFDGSSWIQTAKVQPDELEDEDFFGRTVALLEDRLAVGAGGDDDAAEDAGAIYVFEYAGGGWNEADKLFAPDASAGQQLGWDLLNWAWDDDTLVYTGTDRINLKIHTFDFDGQSWSAQVISDPNPDDRLDLVIPKVDGDVMTTAGFLTDKTYRFDRASGTWAYTREYSFDIADFAGDLAFEVDQPAHTAAVWDLCGEPCDADWDGNESLDTRDVIAFLNAWSAGDPGADMNGDGIVDSKDVTVFLDLWAAGC